VYGTVRTVVWEDGVRKNPSYPMPTYSELLAEVKIIGKKARAFNRPMAWSGPTAPAEIFAPVLAAGVPRTRNIIKLSIVKVTLIFLENCLFLKIFLDRRILCLYIRAPEEPNPSPGGDGKPRVF